MKAVRDALGKLMKDDGNLEDAEAVCGREVLSQIFKWKVIPYTSYYPRICQFYQVLFCLSQCSNEESVFCFEILC